MAFDNSASSINSIREQVAVSLLQNTDNLRLDGNMYLLYIFATVTKSFSLFHYYIISYARQTLLGIFKRNYFSLGFVFWMTLQSCAISVGSMMVTLGLLMFLLRFDLKRVILKKKLNIFISIVHGHQTGFS